MFGNTWANQTLNYCFRTAEPAYWLALHVADPTPAGDLATEVMGNGYEREEIIFSLANGRMLYNTNSCVFTVPNTIVSHLGVWDNKHFSPIICYEALSSPIRLKADDPFIVSPGEFVISL